MNELLAKIAGDYGTPCFVYQLDEVNKRTEQVRSVFGKRFFISYAIKSNPNHALLRRLPDRVDMLDLSSGGELRRAIEAEWQPKRLSFTGPGKSDAELHAAVKHQIGEVIIESVNEAERLNTIAANVGMKQNILIRISPMKVPRGFGVNMAGKPCQFGIDEEVLDLAIETIQKMQHLVLNGFHIYSGTQCLRGDSIIENYKIFIDIFRRFSNAHNIYPKKLIFGSGLGIPYHENDQPLNLVDIAEQVNPALDELRREQRFIQTDFILEMGRYLIGEAGFYLTRVINKKRSRGTDICICDGGMNHHLAACGHLGSVIHRNYQMFKVTNVDNNAPLQPYNLVGPLCTSIDQLGHGIKFPNLEIGDVIAIRSSGAYGLTASPTHFISHGPPKEIIVETIDGELCVEDVSCI